MGGEGMVVRGEHTPNHADIIVFDWIAFWPSYYVETLLILRSSCTECGRSFMPSGFLCYSTSFVFRLMVMLFFFFCSDT